MKARSMAIMLLAATTIGHSLTSYAEICYDVGDSLNTENITPILQISTMDLTLSKDEQLVFSKSGSLVGNITRNDGFGTTIMSHQTIFPKGNSFRTEGDVAQFVGIAGVEPDGTYCAFEIVETITDIPNGTRIFKNVTDFEVIATATVSNCSYFNENAFTLSGNLCVE
jgi:hypothetical protein